MMSMQLDSSSELADLQPGSLLFKRYLVEHTLGEGGLGVVVAAKDRVLRRRVAIKCLRPEHRDSAAAGARFLREGRAMARLESPHAIRIYDARPGALVMECLTGADLGRLLAERGKLRWPQGVSILRQACEALSEAHGMGIIHRDLKLENLFVIQRPGVKSRAHVKVLDFGLSKVLSEGAGFEGDVTLTDTQCVLGSAEFMSPEQARSSKEVDARTDIWALGVVLYNLLSGRGPFARRFAVEVRRAVIDGDYVPLKRAEPHLPSALAAVVERCLQVDPTRRYASVDELALELAQISRARAPSGAHPDEET